MKNSSLGGTSFRCLLLRRGTWGFRFQINFAPQKFSCNSKSLRVLLSLSVHIVFWSLLRNGTRMLHVSTYFLPCSATGLLPDQKEHQLTPLTLLLCHTVLAWSALPWGHCRHDPTQDPRTMLVWHSVVHGGACWSQQCSVRISPFGLPFPWTSVDLTLCCIWQITAVFSGSARTPSLSIQWPKNFKEGSHFSAFNLLTVLILAL